MQRCGRGNGEASRGKQCQGAMTTLGLKEPQWEQFLELRIQLPIKNVGKGDRATTQ